GYYVVATFTAEPAAQPELDRVLNLADEVIRHKVLVRPPKGRHAKRAEARGERPRTIASNEEADASPAPA
ncbi:MAG: 30S ribosomal protein S6, partial [Actinomycetota bacterium]|nr:30S ribosomal protein S6 [Actinomycetota bacterium]